MIISNLIWCGQNLDLMSWYLGGGGRGGGEGGIYLNKGYKCCFTDFIQNLSIGMHSDIDISILCILGMMIDTI